MEGEDSGEFNIHEAADEIIADGDSQADSLDSGSQSGQSEDSLEKTEESNESNPEEILKQLSEEKEAPEQFAELLKGVNSLGLIRNGLPINIETKEQLSELVQKGFDYTQKTMEHAEIVKAKDAEFTQKEAHFKGLEAQYAQKEQEFSTVIQSNQIMGSIVERLQSEDPELFAHLDKLYLHEESVIQKQNSYKSEVQNELKSRDERINSLAQKIDSKEKTEVKQGFEKELSEVQTRLAAPLQKLGVKVDWDKVKQSWSADVSNTLSVEQAMYAAYGKEIAAANESHKKLLTTKAKAQEKLINRTGVNSAQRGGEVAIEVMPGDYGSILRQASATM